MARPPRVPFFVFASHVPLFSWLVGIQDPQTALGLGCCRRFALWFFWQTELGLGYFRGCAPTFFLKFPRSPWKRKPRRGTKEHLLPKHEKPIVVLEFRLQNLMQRFWFLHIFPKDFDDFWCVFDFYTYFQWFLMVFVAAVLFLVFCLLSCCKTYMVYRVKPYNLYTPFTP